MTTLPTQEVAALVPCSVEYVGRLRDLGLLEPGEGDGLYPSSDVHIVRLMAAFEAVGVSLEDVARGVAAGELTFPFGHFMPAPEPLSQTFEELGAKLDRPPEFLRRLSSEFGLAPAAEDRVREEDAKILTQMVSTLEFVDEEDLSRLARLYGGGVQRVVASGVQFFDSAIRRRVADFDLSSGEQDRITFGQAEAFTELASELLPWLQRRHRESLILEYLVGLTEGFMDERGITPRQSRRPPAIAFLDLSGYTEFSEKSGDEAVADVAAGLARIVGRTARTHGGKPVKWLGDGVMFYFADPGSAILGGLELVGEAEKSLSMPVHIGVNAGWVIAQDGDYFGRTVNVAARIADYAGPHEVLVSEQAKRCSSASQVAFELVGDVSLKGLSKPVRLYRAAWAEVE
jgi:class 3 adenylate cyclase